MIDTKGKHQCSVCKAWSAWSDQWQWYGSYRDLDDGRPVLKMCSDDCRRGLDAPRLSAMLGAVQRGEDPTIMRRARAD